MIIGQNTTIQEIRNILVEELSYFMPGKRIFIYNQEFVLEPTQHPWIVLKHLGSKVYSNQNFTFIDNLGNFNEEQDVLTQEIIGITIMSKDLAALQYKEAIPMALASIYSQQQQETLTFKLPRTMQAQDLSELEGGSMIYRFDWTLNVLACYQLIKTQKYFDTFETEVIVNDQGTGTIIEEFNPAVLPPI